jgi:hypothetical protein
MHGEGIVQTTNLAECGLRLAECGFSKELTCFLKSAIRNPHGPQSKGAAKAVVVRKSVARKGVRVRVPPSAPSRLTVDSKQKFLSRFFAPATSPHIVHDADTLAHMVYKHHMDS